MPVRLIRQRFVPVFSGLKVARFSGEFPPPHHPPLRGVWVGGGKDHSPLPDDKRRLWLSENLPLVASIVSGFASAFGRSNFSVSYASEAGHVLGKVSADAPGVTGNDQARAKPCDGCRHLFMKLVSPEGKHQQRACKLYKVAAIKCADWGGK